MNQLRRYTRAFWGALRMTLRGQQYTPAPVDPVILWINQYLKLVEAIVRTADQNGVDRAARQQAKLRLDGRQITLETALSTLKFHASEEYPSLLRQGTGRGVQNTLYATNMNDRYWVSKLMESPELQKPEIQAALSTLGSHLENIPRL